MSSKRINNSSCFFSSSIISSGWVNDQGEFYQLGSISKFWSSTQNDDGSGKVWARIVGFKFMSVSIKPENGYSVRLIKK